MEIHDEERCTKAENTSEEQMAWKAKKKKKKESWRKRQENQSIQEEKSQYT